MFASNEAGADDGDIPPVFGRLDAPLATKAPSGKGAKQHKVHVVTIVAPDGTPETHVGSHDFFTFRRGIECATCKQSACMCCNTCLVCHACFSAYPRPCTEAAVNVVDHVCEVDENNNATKMCTSCKPNKGRVVAGMQAKLVMAAESGKVRDWPRTTLSHCLDWLGVTLPSGTNRQQQEILLCSMPRLCWHRGMPLCPIWTM